MIESKFLAPWSVEKQILATVEEAIRGEIGCLSPIGVRDSYRKEARYLYKNWLGYMALYHDRQLPEYAQWTLAQDFAARFPHHTYEEWAHVFGVPKEHPVIRANALDPWVVANRRMLAAQIASTKEGLRAARWALLCMVVMVMNSALNGLPVVAWSMAGATVFFASVTYRFLYREGKRAGLAFKASNQMVD